MENNISDSFGLQHYYTRAKCREIPRKLSQTFQLYESKQRLNPSDAPNKNNKYHGYRYHRDSVASDASKEIYNGNESTDLILMFNVPKQPRANRGRREENG